MVKTKQNLSLLCSWQVLRNHLINMQIVILIQWIMIGRDGIESVLLCECKNNHTILKSLTSFSNCQGEGGACAAKDGNICFATRTGKGCISWHECVLHDDRGYAVNKTFIKCCKSNYCNSLLDQNKIDEYGEEHERKPITSNNGSQEKGNERAVSENNKLAEEKRVLLVVFAPCLVISVGAILAALLILRHQRKKKCQRNNKMIFSTRTAEESLISSYTGSGSGMGAAHLSQKTLSWSIVLREQIGSGGFGTVRVGFWNGQEVAVKIIESNEQESWEQEKDLYNTKLLNHKNILGFIGADIKEDACSIQRWLVFDYHANGSVYDYLQTQSLDTKSMLKMVTGIVDGLHHLHEEILTILVKKPAIAHRDIKTKNILVKLDGTCCLADFGLAFKHTRAEGFKDQPPAKILVGTARYQAPELMDGQVQSDCFEVFMRTDIYSFALCLWEICRRTKFGDVDEMEYELPYLKDVPKNPTSSDMFPVVFVEGIRPSFPQHWENEKTMKLVTRLLKECWAANPNVRLTISRVRKRIQSILTVVEEEEEDDKCHRKGEKEEDEYGDT